MEIVLDIPKQIIRGLQAYAEEHGISIDEVVADFLAPDFYKQEIEDDEDEEWVIFCACRGDSVKKPVGPLNCVA